MTRHNIYTYKINPAADRVDNKTDFTHKKLFKTLPPLQGTKCNLPHFDALKSINLELYKPVHIRCCKGQTPINWECYKLNSFH